QGGEDSRLREGSISCWGAPEDKCDALRSRSPTPARNPAEHDTSGQDAKLLYCALQPKIRRMMSTGLNRVWHMRKSHPKASWLIHQLLDLEPSSGWVEENSPAAVPKVSA